MILFPPKQYLSVYPNPTTTSIIAEYQINDLQNVHIYLTDFSGKIVKEFKVDHPTKGINYQQINFDNKLSQGLYYIILRTGSEVFTKKVVYQQRY